MERTNRGIIGEIAYRPISFSVVFFLFVFTTVSLLATVDALPEPKTATVKPAEVVQPVEVVKAENPIRVTATTIGLDTHIENPESTNVDVLDHALLSGAVRYPTSARLGQKGTVLLFGHSSNLPVIHNKAFKAFRGIQNLHKGDTVSVYSATAEYRYAVESVSLADASEDVIELRKDGRYLTLVTCDTFSKKTSRFVVTAKFVGTYSLASH